MEKVLVSTKGRDNTGIEIIQKLCNKVRIEIVNADSQVTKLAGEKAFAVGVFRKYEERVKSNKNHIVLVCPNYHGNVGTIIRTMLGFDFRDLVIIGPSVDIFHPNVIRASMGGIFNIRLSNYDTIDYYIKDFSEHKFYPFMLGGKSKLHDAEFKSPLSLIFGSEGSGLSKEFSDVGMSIEIKQSSSIDSLNLAMSARIGMYEVSKKI